MLEAVRRAREIANQSFPGEFSIQALIFFRLSTCLKGFLKGVRVLGVFLFKKSVMRCEAFFNLVTDQLVACYCSYPHGSKAFYLIKWISVIFFARTLVLAYLHIRGTYTLT